MTIESKSIIRILLENDGAYPGDPQAYSIYEYLNTGNGRKMFAVFMGDYSDLDTSPYVGEYKLLWQVGSGLTKEGKKWLIDN